MKYELHERGCRPAKRCYENLYVSVAVRKHTLALLSIFFISLYNSGPLILGMSISGST